MDWTPTRLTGLTESSPPHKMGHPGLAKLRPSRPLDASGLTGLVNGESVPPRICTDVADPPDFQPLDNATPPTGACLPAIPAGQLIKPTGGERAQEVAIWITTFRQEQPFQFLSMTWWARS